MSATASNPPYAEPASLTDRTVLSSYSFRYNWFFQLTLASAAVAVGYAIHVRDGEFWRGAIHCVGFAILACLAAFVVPRLRWQQWGERLPLIAVFLIVLFQFGLLIVDSPSGANWWSNDLVHTSARNFRVYDITIRVAFGLFLLSFWKFPTWGRWIFPLVLACHLVLGGWMIRSSPNPQIDVFVFQQVGAEALLHGDNPYAITYPNIYDTTRQGDQAVYGRGLMKDGKLSFGFPYTPVSLLLSTIGYVIAGDHRYAQLVALTLAGAFLAYARPSRIALLAAVGLLFMPRTFFILGRAWTEPFVICGLAAAVFAATRFISNQAASPARSRGWWIALVIALGLFWSTKQYLALAVPLAWVLLPTGTPAIRRIVTIATALLVCAAVSLPLALWDWSAFFHSTVTVQGKAPFRKDALSYLVLWYQYTGIEPAGGRAVLPAFAGAIAMLALALWRSPRSPAGYAASLALVYLPFIALNKQAFANYYLFPIAALWIAVATSTDTAYAPVERKLNPSPGTPGEPG